MFKIKEEKKLPFDTSGLEEIKSLLGYKYGTMVYINGFNYLLGLRSNGVLYDRETNELFISNKEESVYELARKGKARIFKKKNNNMDEESIDSLIENAKKTIKSLL